MIKQRYWMAIPVVVWMVMLAGCSQAMMDGFFATSVAESREFTQQVLEGQTVHGADMARQHTKMHPEAQAGIRASRTQFEAELEQINERVKEVHSKVGEIIKKATEMGLEVATGFGGLKGDTVAGFVSKLVGIETDKVRTDLVAGLKVVNTAVDKEAAKRAAEMKAMKAEIMAAAEARLALLTEETRLKLSNVSAEALTELEKLKGDDKAFREKLRAAAKLTDAEMEALKGLSTEEIMAMLAAAGLAAGAGGALGKTGKSRSHAEIEKLKDVISDITTAAALEKPSPSVDAIVRHGTK